MFVSPGVTGNVANANRIVVIVSPYKLLTAKTVLLT